MTLWVMASASAMSAMTFAGSTGSSEGRNAVGDLSARFAEHSTLHVSGDALRMKTVGAFDWTRRRGWSTTTTAGTPAATLRIVQLGDFCWRRFGGGGWRRSRATDVDRLCDAAAFADPATIVGELRPIADRWRKTGTSSIDGVVVTHYAGSIHIGAAVSGPFDLWVDDRGIVRREIFHHGNLHDGSVTRRDYYDFGTRVVVTAPKGTK